jgi:hypothetical protein
MMGRMSRLKETFAGAVVSAPCTQARATRGKPRIRVTFFIREISEK